jgi:hypothetical protein
MLGASISNQCWTTEYQEIPERKVERRQADNEHPTGGQIGGDQHGPCLLN